MCRAQYKGVGGGNTPRRSMDFFTYLFTNILTRVRDFCLATIALFIIAPVSLFFVCLTLILFFCKIIFGDLVHQNNKIISWNVYRHDTFC